MHRAKGALNKITRDIREGAIAGFARHGSNGRGEGGFSGFCFYLAKKHPKAAVRIIEKLLPLTVNGTPGMFGGNHISTVNVVSVPSGSFLSQEDIDRMRGRPTILDHETAAPPKQLEICPETEPVIEQSVQNAREFEPQTERERRLLAELEALSPDQRLFGDNDKSNNDDAA